MLRGQPVKSEQAVQRTSRAAGVVQSGALTRKCSSRRLPATVLQRSTRFGGSGRPSPAAIDPLASKPHCRWGSYGPTGGLQHGARVIELRLGEDPAGSATWVRQQDGSQQFQAAAPEVRCRAGRLLFEPSETSRGSTQPCRVMHHTSGCPVAWPRLHCCCWCCIHTEGPPPRAHPPPVAAHAPLQDRPRRQHSCNLDASACDKALGPRACLALRSARNAATLLAVLAGLAATTAVTAAAALILVRRSRQHASRQRGWQRVDSTEKPLGAAAAV